MTVGAPALPILESVRDRLALPVRGGVLALESRADIPGFGPAIGTIVPDAFSPPTAAVLRPAPPVPVGSAPPDRPNDLLKGGRLSWDDMNMFGAGLPVILPPDQTQDEWRRLDLDSDRIKFMSADRLLRILVEGSPDVSRGLWDFLRLMNPGWTATAYRPGTRTPSTQGQKIVDDFVRRMNKRYGSIDVLLARYHFGGFLRGALFSEIVFDDTGLAVDLVTPDPVTARFRQRVDPILGRVWDLGQFQGGTWVDLSGRETIQYIPIDAAPASPYGRPICSPAIFASLFVTGLLLDLRRVVAQQGWPRFDLKVIVEQLKKLAPPQVVADPLRWKKWVDDTIAEIQHTYNQLEPDSAFVHTDILEVNAPKGAVSSDALSGIDPVIRALERQLARALKTMPLMMGSTEGQSEANANRQWELQAAGIKAVQHLSESDLSEKCNLLCEAQGVAAEVEWHFAEFRRAEAYRDAMTKGLEIDNATKLWLLGVIGQEELADMTTGEPSDQDEPRFIPRTEVNIDTAESGGTTTGSPTATGSPAGPQPNDKPKGPGSQTEEGDEQDPNARAARDRGLLSKIAWPSFPLHRHPRDSVAGRNPRRQQRAAAPGWRPKGGPLAGVPAEVNYDEGDQRRARRVWDEAVPEMAGILDAQPIGPEDEDERQLDIELARLAEHQPNGTNGTNGHHTNGANGTNGTHRAGTVVAAPAPPAPSEVDVLREQIADLADEVRELRRAPTRVRKTVQRDERGQIVGVLEEPVR